MIVIWESQGEGGHCVGPLKHRWLVWLVLRILSAFCRHWSGSVHGLWMVVSVRPIDSASSSDCYAVPGLRYISLNDHSPSPGRCHKNLPSDVVCSESTYEWQGIKITSHKSSKLIFFFMQVIYIFGFILVHPPPLSTSLASYFIRLTRIADI